MCLTEAAAAELDLSRPADLVRACELIEMPDLAKLVEDFHFGHATVRRVAVCRDVGFAPDFEVHDAVVALLARCGIRVEYGPATHENANYSDLG